MTTLERRTAEGAEPRERLDRYLRENGLNRSHTTVVPLTGDASDRRYFRIISPDGVSIVLALHAGPIAFDSLPFVNVAELLRQMPLPVPSILGHSDALGILALVDLGDVSLLAHLRAAAPKAHAALYRQAIEFIEVLQRRGTELAQDAYLPYRVAFDVEKLTWELDFFIKHFVEGFRGASISNAERAALHQEFSSIVAELAAEPRVLCHRDYHSRNLMVHDHGLSIIDFQDARQGPDTYDLVSLLRDSYVDLEDRDVEDLVAYFLALKGHPASPPSEFRRRFDLMSLQRNLKALGTFGYQTMTRRNTVYIQYIPRTLRYVRNNLETYPRFARLHELLAGHIEELRA
jgi:aminoglycoside/choline kinase family phosphotransferase